ncbi:hypothetical protein N7492_009445 [Penicillium capsulatum]|uniref:SET domain-containing protein n=1 Tax=Penicillium capsulatum TaxID=69766 RepID=A0A9W9LI38_9EURO|nr:hypothetical protein N7492_009445 [Penicillium capsulatum]KAJ6106835.1 hypothetical protein N7512_010352 [Penicillium capsulatum]
MASTEEQSTSHSLESHKELVEWVTTQGGFIADSVCVAQDEPRGVHLQVKEGHPTAVSKETRVINTPIGVTISYFNAINYQSARGAFKSHDVDFPRAFIDAVGPEETTTFFLMGQFLLGPRSFWYPYLRTLPQPGQLTTPLFFGEEDVDWIHGTGIQEAAVQRYQAWDEKFEASIAKLQELGFESWDIFTMDLYLWASTIITSRAFSAKVLSESVDASDFPDDGVSVLLPLIDLPNHRPLAKVEWRAGNQDVGMIVLEDIGAGEEISNNYGPRNNEQLLMNYGFCLPNNPCDYRIVKLGVQPDSPLSVVKSRQVQMFPELANNKDDHYYIFNVFYPLLAPDCPMEHSIVSPALFNALAVMQANERERQQVEITEASVSIPTHYGNRHSTLAALAQISFELESHIAMLQVTAEDLPEQPTNLKQTFAQIYRNGQITLDKTALIIATWTLARARDHTRSESWQDIKALLHEHISQIPAGYFPEEIVSRMRVRILERQSLVPKNGELFRLVELFNLLPANLQEPSRKCFERYSTFPGLGQDPQAMFAVVICLLAATSRSPQVQPQLSSRLARWVDFLVEHYPLPSEGENDMTPGRKILGQLSQSVSPEQVFAWNQEDGADWLVSGSGWLDAKWLQWACTVQEGESVFIPFEPLRGLTEPGRMSPKQAVLYVPQE